MGIAPRKPAERVLFYVNKTKATGPWKVNATGIGSSATAVDALNALALAAQAALADQQAKQDAARTATQTAKQAVAAMSVNGAEVIAAIKAKALVAGDSIYALADIPAPATPSPVGAPGTPTDFKVELVQGGALVLSWRCPNPANAQGTVYQIARKIGAGPGAAAVIIGSVGTRSFVDDSVPATAAAAGGVTYQVTAIRSTKKGLLGQTLVEFGTGGAGEMTASIVSPPNLAA